MKEKLRVQFFSFGFQREKFIDFHLELQSHLRNPPPDSFLTWIWAWVSVCQVVLLSPFLQCSDTPQSLGPCMLHERPFQIPFSNFCDWLEGYSFCEMRKAVQNRMSVPWENSAFGVFLCQTSWKAGERRESVFNNSAESLCPWRQETLLEWIDPHPWPGRTVFEKI